MAAAEREPAPRATSWAGHAATDREQQHALKRQAILQAAASAFRETGCQYTSLNDIARRLHVTKPTLYYYIRDREDILLGCQRTGFEQFMVRLNEVTARGLDGQQMLRAIMTCYGEWVTSDYGVCVVQMWNERVSAETRRKLDEARSQVQSALRNVIRTGIEDGSLRECDVSAAASALLGAFNWMPFWYDAQRASSSPTQISERIVNVFIDGMAADPAPRARAGEGRAPAGEGRAPAGEGRAPARVGRPPAVRRVSPRKRATAARK